MKKITILLLFFCMTSPTWGAVSAKVYLSDGITPLELADPCVPFVYRDVMVRTKLTIIVASNAAEYWESGALAMEEENMTYIGHLYGRGPDELGNYLGSCLPDAGADPAVWDTVSYGYGGFELYGGDDPDVGDWFIFDYNALDIGDCKIELRDFNAEPELIQTISLNHVRTRDFNTDPKVDFRDYAILASHWLETDCNNSGWCQGTDLDIDGNVDFNDLMLFCEYWLEKTE